MSLDNLLKLKRKNEPKKTEIDGVELHIRSFSALERAELLDILEDKYGVTLQDIQQSTEKIHVTNKGVYEHTIYTVVFGLSDEEGNRLFKGNEEGFEVVKELEVDAINKLNEEILRYNGMDKNSKKQAVKN